MEFSLKSFTDESFVPSYCLISTGFSSSVLSILLTPQPFAAIKITDRITGKVTAPVISFLMCKPPNLHLPVKFVHISDVSLYPLGYYTGYSLLIFYDSLSITKIPETEMFAGCPHCPRVAFDGPFYLGLVLLPDTSLL